MPAARITREQYDALVEAFREQPGKFAPAARRAGIIHRTAKRAWELGWERPEWARPIREVLEEEQVAARARLYEEERAKALAGARRREEQELARLDAAKERAREAEGVRAALSASLSLLANLGQFSRASIVLSQRAAQDLIAEANAGTVPWREAMPFLTKLAWIGSQATGQLKDAMEAIRLHLGEPGKILGVAQVGASQGKVDGDLAVDALGRDTFAKALGDAIAGEMSPELERFLSWHADQSSDSEVH